jgi:hypothetical protein
MVVGRRPSCSVGDPELTRPASARVYAHSFVLRSSLVRGVLGRSGGALGVVRGCLLIDGRRTGFSVRVLNFVFLLSGRGSDGCAYMRVGACLSVPLSHCRCPPCGERRLWSSLLSSLPSSLLTTMTVSDRIYSALCCFVRNWCADTCFVFVRPFLDAQRRYQIQGMFLSRIYPPPLASLPFVPLHPYPPILPVFISLTCLTIQERKTSTKAASKPRATKAKKDKNAPKRALSAYMFFSQDWRERIKAENPDASFGQSSLFVNIVGVRC